MSDQTPGPMLALGTLLLALMLQIVPLPEAFAGLRPDWVLLTLLFWCLTLPQRFGLFGAFCLGLVLDSLSGALLGQHALAMVLATFLALKFRLRLRVFPLAQLTVAVVLLIGIYQFTLFWIDGVSGRTVPLEQRWMPLITGALVWPLLFLLLDRSRDEASDKATPL